MVRIKVDYNIGNPYPAIIIIGGVKYVSTLEDSLKDKDKYVRINAARVLKKITGKEYDWRLKK